MIVWHSPPASFFRSRWCNNVMCLTNSLFRNSNSMIRRSSKNHKIKKISKDVEVWSILIQNHDFEISLLQFLKSFTFFYFFYLPCSHIDRNKYHSTQNILTNRHTQSIQKNENSIYFWKLIKCLKKVWKLLDFDEIFCFLMFFHFFEIVFLKSTCSPTHYFTPRDKFVP